MRANSYKLVANLPTFGVSQTFSLEKGRRYLLGSAEMEPDMLVFSFDRSMSRRQAWLEVVDDVLHVERHPNSSQSLNGDPATKTLQLRSGETFTTGLTVFRFVAAEDADVQLAPGLTYTLSARDFSARMQERGTRSFLEVVSEMPPLMQKNATPADFLFALCGSLQAHVSGLEVTAWHVQLHEEWPEVIPLRPPDSSGISDGKLFPTLPSRHLVKQAFSSDREDCVVSFWNRGAGATDAAHSMISSGAEWAMCIPISLSERERFALYATSTQALLATEQREIQHILAAIGTMAKQHLLAAQTKERQGQIGQFFSPALRSILLGEVAEADQILRPGEYEATICFFDLRGFSQAAENLSPNASEKPAVAEHFALLERILGEATGVIFDTGGMVIDFQGDAIMACWGVPPHGAPSDPTRQAAVACRRMVELMMVHDWPAGESRLRCGIGMTRGRVLAGLFAAQCAGRTMLSKYTVMGPVVNQAARLEGMAKKFSVPILVDGAVAEVLASENILVRRIATVRPAGMSQVVKLYEMILPKELGGTGMTAEGVSSYEVALAFFEKGNFEAAAEAMRFVPHDQIELFLSEQIIAMRRHGAPPGWDGVINLLSK